MKKGMRFYFILCSLFILSLFSNSIYAQDPQTLEVGFHGGVAYYLGDINPGKHFDQSQAQLGLVARFNYNPRWAYRFEYTYLNLTSSDASVKYRPERDLGFSTNVNDFALIAEFNFFEYYTGSSRRNISPYLFGGFSVFTFSTHSYDGSVDLRPLMTEGQQKMYSNVSWSVPFGFGCKLSLSEHLGLAVEWRMQKTFTDYIDDVSKLYPENSVVVNDYNYSDPTDSFAPGMQRGDSSNNDWFGILGASITYKFNLPGKQLCNLK